MIATTDTLQMKTSAGHDISLGGDAVFALQQSIKGTLIGPEDERYDEYRRVWNGLIDKKPALIARCAGKTDVVATVNFARAYDLLFAVRAGGHNVAGNAVCEDGLVIDLSGMRDVQVDPKHRTIQVAGGATLGDLDRATQAFGLAVPTGLVSATGVAGLTLHGGMGWLTRQYGLTLDSLISAEVVTADGRLLRADEAENADLFWAIRGGGGNFGVVTSLEFRAYPVGPEVWFLAALYPMSQAEPLLKAIRNFMIAAPEELGILVSLWSASNESQIPENYRGAPILALLGCYTGPFEKGEAVIQSLRELGEPVVDLGGPRPFVQVQTFLDADYPDGMLYYWKSAYLRHLNDDVSQLLIEYSARRPSPLSSLDIWFPSGAMNHVPPKATAFAKRDAAYVLGIEANWTDPAQTDANIAWARAVYDAVQPFARGEYLNFPGFIEDSSRLLQGVYGANYQRLQTIKARYDPDNLFKGVLNIPPRL